MMSQKELGRYALIKGSLDGKYTVRETARLLGLSARRVKQLKKAARTVGESAVIHGNAGRHPANYTEDALRERIVALKKSADYADTNFTHFRELLEEREHIKIGYTALCGILKRAGIMSKRTHRTSGRKFCSRLRRPAFGELLQTDATLFDWFGSGKRSALHGFIDDATGKITALYLCKNECLMGYLEILRHTLREYGIPQDIYGDKVGVLFVNTKKHENWTIEEQLAGKTLNKTQFGRIAEKLGIGLIPAHTPQAKGRIERLWNTLHDRLFVWFKLNGVSDIDTANKALPRFIAEYNAKFAVKPASDKTAFVPIAQSDDIDKLLSVRYERVTDNCGCFSFQNFKFQIEADKVMAKKKITFLFNQNIGFLAMLEKSYYAVRLVGNTNIRKFSHAPEITKLLMQKYYFADEKHNPAPL